MHLLVSLSQEFSGVIEPHKWSDKIPNERAFLHVKWIHYDTVTDIIYIAFACDIPHSYTAPLVVIEP